MNILHIVDYIGPQGGLYQILKVLDDNLKPVNINASYLALENTPYKLDEKLVTLPIRVLKEDEDFFSVVDNINPDIIHIHSDLKNEYFEYCLNNYQTLRSIFDCGPFCPIPKFDNAFCKYEPLFNKKRDRKFINSNCIHNKCINQENVVLFNKKIELLKKVNGLVCLSSACAEYSEKMGVSKSKIFKMPPIMHTTHEYSSTKENVILFAGRMVHHKGTEYLLKSLVKLKNQNYKLILEGTGDKEYVASLVRFIIENGIEEKVEIIGHNTYDDYLNMFSKVRFLVFPSVYAEGFGYPAYEAMLRGVPVIAFEGIGGVREWLVHDYNGIVVPFMDIEKLADAIDRLLTDEKLYQKYRTNSIEWSKSTNFDKEIEIVKNYYLSFVNKT